ncbi:hypothetical protein JNW88_22470, partial [Micromonospora sp. ATA32]|nr:hypothetical protein [Micromonospora sp. ATA32]
MRDAQSFDEFYRSTARRMARYGYAVAGDHSEAQDLVQEAYARAWRQWRTLAAHPAPEAWLRLVVTRLAGGPVATVAGACARRWPAPGHRSRYGHPTRTPCCWWARSGNCPRRSARRWRCTTCSTCPSRTRPGGAGADRDGEVLAVPWPDPVGGRAARSGIRGSGGQRCRVSCPISTTRSPRTPTGTPSPTRRCCAGAPTGGPDPGAATVVAAAVLAGGIAIGTQLVPASTERGPLPPP